MNFDLTHMHSNHHLISLLGQPLGTMYNENKVILGAKNKKEKLENERVVPWAIYVSSLCFVVVHGKHVVVIKIHMTKTCPLVFGCKTYFLWCHMPFPGNSLILCGINIHLKSQGQLEGMMYPGLILVTH